MEVFEAAEAVGGRVKTDRVPLPGGACVGGGGGGGGRRGGQGPQSVLSRYFFFFCFKQTIVFDFGDWSAFGLVGPKHVDQVLGVC